MLPLIEITDPALYSPDTIIIDARAGNNSRERYQVGHLKNAAFVDLDTNLSAKVTDASFGGRHPLAPIHDFAALLGRLGITPESYVVVYDDKAAAFGGARFWWMLKAVGHKKVQVLNGGLQAAINAGFELSTEDYVPISTNNYPVFADYEGTVDLKKTGAAAHNPAHVVIDVRESARYSGQTEPIDLIAGHIPGAVNLPYTYSLDADGKYLSPDILQKIYKNIIGDVEHNNVIVHCGSGVTACHTLLGMEYAGITGPQLYIGSWSEWSRRGLPINTLTM